MFQSSHGYKDPYWTGKWSAENNFRCLLGDGLPYEPVHDIDIITAMCVPHNISKSLNKPNLDAYTDVDLPPEPDTINIAGAEDRRSGAVTGMQIVNDIW